MLAYKIQSDISEKTGKSVQLEEHPDGRFQIFFNETLVYDCLPLQTSEVDQAEIAKRHSTYNLANVAAIGAAADPDDSNDSDHLEWMNCVCSGE